MGSFNPNLKKYELKSTEELSIMAMENYTKFEEELTCHFKVDIDIFILIGSFSVKYILFELRSTEELSFMKPKRDKKFGEESTCVSKLT